MQFTQVLVLAFASITFALPASNNGVVSNDITPAKAANNLLVKRDYYHKRLRYCEHIDFGGRCNDVEISNVEWGVCCMMPSPTRLLGRRTFIYLGC